MNYLEFKNKKDFSPISKFQNSLKATQRLFDENMENNTTIWFSDLLIRFINVIENDNLNNSKTLLKVLEIYKTLLITVNQKVLVLA